MLGGSELSVKLLAENLMKRGYSPIVFAFDGKCNSVENINGVKVIRSKVLTDHCLPLALLPYVAITMKRWENYVDFYHIYHVTPISGAGLYKLLGGSKPVVATLNNYFGFCPVSQIFGECWNCTFTKSVRCRLSQEHSVSTKIASVPYSCVFPLLKKLSKRLDYYIALSVFVKRIYVNFGFNQKRIIVIPNFADKTIVRPNKERHIQKRPFTFLYVGRLSSGKGVETLLRAFSDLSKVRKDLQLFIVGTGSEMKKCTELTELLRISDKVIFFGYKKNDDLYKVYSLADVMVHPAIWPEPFGRTLLEALSFEVPLIVSSAGAPPEIVGNAGLIFESGNVIDLREKMQLVMDNDEGLNDLRSNCLRVVENYVLDCVLKRIIELYQKIVKA
jgi:glycosyltransferase involved in cell wall biosynthesis